MQPAFRAACTPPTCMGGVMAYGCVHGHAIILISHLSTTAGAPCRHLIAPDHSSAHHRSHAMPLSVCKLLLVVMSSSQSWALRCLVGRRRASDASPAVRPGAWTPSDPRACAPRRALGALSALSPGRVGLRSPRHDDGPPRAVCSRGRLATRHWHPILPHRTSPAWSSSSCAPASPQNPAPCRYARRCASLAPCARAARRRRRR